MKLKCKNCGKTVAHISETGLLRLSMKGRRVIVTGNNYSAVASCSFCRHDNTIEVEAGKLLTEGLKLEKEQTAPIEKPEPKPSEETPKPKDEEEPEEDEEVEDEEEDEETDDEE